jgi:hypothetical protein
MLLARHIIGAVSTNLIVKLYSSSGVIAVSLLFSFLVGMHVLSEAVYYYTTNFNRPAKNISS